MKMVESTAQPHARPRRTLVLALLSALVAEPQARGQTAAGEPSPGQSAPQGGALPEIPWYARDRFDRARFMNELSSSHFLYSRNPRPESAVIFLPPVPPPLESEIPLLAPLGSGPPAPPELAPFVGDVFYPLLGSRLASDNLPKSLRARIVAYLDAKVALQGELRSRILALKDVDSKSRERQLADLAALQAPRIAELESTAEQLRSDLRPNGVFGVQTENPGPDEGSAWSMHSVRNAPEAAADVRREAGALRGAAFREEGLSLSQRRLLCEAAVELEAGAGADRPGPQAVPGPRTIAFSPEPARILIPAGLEPGLAREVDEFLSAKSALKAELRDVLRRTGDSNPEARRTALEKLAAAQAPRIAAYEEMAEEIRRGLAALPNPQGPPPPPALPAELTARISAYRTHKVELLRRLRAMLAAPPPASEPGQAPPETRPDDIGAGAQAWLHDGASTTEVQPSSLRVSVAEFGRLQDELISALNREEAGIRESLAAYVRASNGPSDRKSINDLLRDFETARQKQELWDRFQDYRTAALMPGLSAGQRRVLFDAGLERLDLPLPDGERTD